MTLEAEHKTHAKKFALPVSIATPVDVGRLQRELTEINEAMLQLGIREPGSKVKVPKTSRLLDQVLEQNDINLLQEKDREFAKNSLEEIRTKAVILHVSFAADPSASFMEKLIAWLRKEVDPNVLVTVGLQPNIGAGCIVRTTNKYFDLSIKQDFLKKRELLLQAIKAKTEASGAHT